MEDMSSHFLPKRLPWCRDGSTWVMVRLGREARSRTDYIMGIDCCIFRNVDIRDPQHNSDNYMVIGCFYSALLREHTNYLGWRTQLPLRPLNTLMREYRLLATLYR